MDRKAYSVLLEGVDALDLPVGVLADLCTFLMEGAQRSARLLVEGRSVARGTPPAWLVPVADIRIRKFERGSLDLGLYAPRLADAAPDIFAQQQLYPTEATHDTTALDLFLEAADDATAGRRDSDRLDAGILDVLSRLSGVFARGGTRLSLSGAGGRTVVLDSHSVSLAKTLSDETPHPQLARVRGMLDTLSVGARSLVLKLDDGSLLRGFTGDLHLEDLKMLLGESVVLEGTVTFRLSGTARRIEVESIVPPSGGDVVWAKPPVAAVIAARSRPTATPNGLDAFFGTWPGDETDNELAAALHDDR